MTMAVATATDFGSRLRWWRTTRRYSQLELGSLAEISTRHLSFLETGRSKPSREMVVHLGAALELPLRDTNALLNAAGFAPAFTEFDLDEPVMTGVRSVLTTILNAHLPNPAVVVDRLGDLVDANGAAIQLMAVAVAPDSDAMLPTPNLNRLTFHPDGIKIRTGNWADVASSLLLRLERERNHRPADADLADLVDEMLGYPGVAELRSGPRQFSGADLIVPLVIDLDDAENGNEGRQTGGTLSLLTTISTIGSPHDVTLDELRLETFFPTDDRSRAILETWSA